MHQHERFRQDREHADFRRAQLGALGNDALPFLDVLTLRPNIGALGFGLENPDAGVGTVP